MKHIQTYSLLRTEMLEELCLVGYAANVVALITACTIDQGQQGVLGVLLLRMTLALNKTEVVVLTKKKIPSVITVQVGDTKWSKPAVD